MALNHTQRAFALLSTQPGLLERFCESPESLAPSLGLTASEWAPWAGAVQSQLRRFARSLARKRLREIEQLLPATAAALGPVFGEWFGRYSRPGTKPCDARPEAIAFARYLRKQIRADRKTPGWWNDVVRFETAWLEAQRPAFTLKWALFRKRRWTFAVWFRPSARSRLRHFVFGWPRYSAW